MSKEPAVPVQCLSILVGVMIACVLAYTYHMTLPSLVYDAMTIPSLLAFVTIPMLSGFIAGLVFPEKAIVVGLYVGLLSGVVNSIMAAIKMLFVPILTWETIYAFAFLAIITIFLWMFITSAAAWQAKVLVQELSGKSNKSNPQKGKPNPGNTKSAHPPNCPYYPKLLDSNNSAIPDVCLTCRNITQCSQARRSTVGPSL